MAKNFSPSEIRRVQVELLDGSNVELSQADVYEMMNRSGGGSRAGSGGVPRERGDEPRAVVQALSHGGCSPRARG